MHDPSTTSLQSLYELMTRMSTAIENSDWETLMTLDHERRDIIKNAIALRSTCNDHQHNDLSQDITSKAERNSLSAQIIELDEKILQSIKQARQQLMKENHENSAQQKAAAGYAQARAFT